MQSFIHPSPQMSSELLSKQPCFTLWLSLTQLDELDRAGLMETELQRQIAPAGRPASEPGGKEIDAPPTHSWNQMSPKAVEVVNFSERGNRGVNFWLHFKCRFLVILV